MSVTDMLPSYKQSLGYVTGRIAELQGQRREAEKAGQWYKADMIHNRIIALSDTAVYLAAMIREIERHAV